MRISVLSVAFMILLASFVPAVPAGSVAQIVPVYFGFGPPSSPVQAEPGMQAIPLISVLANEGNGLAENVSLRVSVFGPVSIYIQPQNASAIYPGGEYQFTAYARIAPNASLGVYRAELNISYVYVLQQAGLYEAYRVSENFTEYISITSYADLNVYETLFGNGSLLAFPGASGVPLVVTIRNAGTGPAFNSSIRIRLSYPFSSYNSTLSYFIGTIPAGMSAPVVFFVDVADNASLGYYPVSVTLSWNNGITREYIEYLRISGSPRISAEAYYTQPPQVFPGSDDVELNVLLVNSGNVSAKNVTARLQVPNGFVVLSSDTYSIGLMPPGYPVRVSFLLDVPENASSPQRVPLIMSIWYQGYNTSETLYLPLQPLANFTLLKDRFNVSAGASSVYITLVVVNHGNVTARGVSAQLMLPNVMSGNTYDYLGDIPPDGNATAVFSVQVSSGIPTGIYSGAVYLTWEQSNAPGVQFFASRPVIFNVEPGSLFGDISSYALYVALAVIAVLAVGVFVVRRRP
ncbi:MAG: COG1361 S-layer family protein [Nitrososphaeria archaeon]